MMIHNNNVNTTVVVAVLVMMILFFFFFLFIIIIIIGPSLTYITSALGSSEQRRRHTHSAQFAEALEEDIDERFLKYQNKQKDSVQDHEPLHAMEPEQIQQQQRE